MTVMDQLNPFGQKNQEDANEVSMLSQNLTGRGVHHPVKDGAPSQGHISYK